MKTNHKGLWLTLLIGTSPTLGNTSVIFSDYIEGSASNKALAIKNVGTESVDLSTYGMSLFSNGSINPQRSIVLTGELAPQQKYVIANGNGVEALTLVADLLDSVANFNGNDVLTLSADGVVVDRIGQIGSAVDFAKDVTLVRDQSVVSGDPNVGAPFILSNEWGSYAQDTFEFVVGSGGLSPAEYACGDDVTLISDIQGNDTYSKMEGEFVAVEAVVTAAYQGDGQLGGFFLQEEDLDADTDIETSEGLFVYSRLASVSVGDRVLVTGEVDEFFDMTQLNNVKQIERCEGNVILPTATEIALPYPSHMSFESIEGMQIEMSHPVTVNDVYNLGRYGEFVVANGRRSIPTEVAPPGIEALALVEENARNMLTVSDGLTAQNPSDILFPGTGLTANNSLRAGDTANKLQGVLNYAFGAFKLLPTHEVVFFAENPRVDLPYERDPSEDHLVRVASLNVFNYFNGDGVGGGFPALRGASTQEEWQRQEAKLVSALIGLDADIIGLMELENDGFGEQSAVASLVNAVNAQLSEEEEYAYVNPGVSRLGDDDIAVGLLYRPLRVEAALDASVLNSQNSPRDLNGDVLFDDTLNRPALAQSFSYVDSNKYFTVVVNHLKSKGGSNCEANNDCGMGDGQGAYNQTRTRAAMALASWVASNPTGVNDTIGNIIMGDLNAYSQEDPIQHLREKGYTQLSIESGYSYVYRGESGYLDYVMASGVLANSVSTVQTWHINADEPRVLDYNTEYKTDEQKHSLYSTSVYRSSDHDPVIVDFLMETGRAPEASFRAFRFLFWWIFVDQSTDQDGDIINRTWTIGSKTYQRSWAIVSNAFLSRENVVSARLDVMDNDNLTSFREVIFR